MATEVVMMPAQEIADLQAQPAEPVAAAPEAPVSELEAQKKPNRAERRITRLCGTIKEQKEQIAKQQEHIARLEAGDFAGLLTEQRNEITKLTLERGELLDKVRQHYRWAKRTEATWEVERQISAALNDQLTRYDRYTRELNLGLERALSLVERYQKLPIVPNLDRYERKK